MKHSILQFKLKPIPLTCVIVCKYWKILGTPSPLDNLLSLPESDYPTQISTYLQPGSESLSQPTESKTSDLQP